MTNDTLSSTTIFDLGQHITNFESKIFNNDLDASHFFYINSPVMQPA